MREVALSKRAIAGAVANWIDAPGFPGHLFISLEHSVGFGEGSGGVGVGSVIDRVTDTESGFFGAMARVDELILNIPGDEELGRFFGVDAAVQQLALSPTMKRTLTEQYTWVFADEVDGTRIRWE